MTAICMRYNRYLYDFFVVSSVPMRNVTRPSLRMRSMSMEEYDMPKLRQRSMSGSEDHPTSPLAASPVKQSSVTGIPL